MSIPRPRRLPTTREELDEWSVYADWLLTRGDPRGEAIARELAVDDDPTDDVRGRYGDSGDGNFELSYTLRHLRGLTIPREMYSVSPVTLDRAHARLQMEDAALVEELALPIEPEHARHVERVFAALPETCVRVAVDLCSPIDEATARDLLAALPAHVREIAIASSGPRLRRVGLTGLTAWIDDRFDAVELRYTRSTFDVALQQMRDDRELVAERVAATQRARIQWTIV